MTESQLKMMEKLGLNPDVFTLKKEGNLEETVKALEEQNEMLIQCILEMADIIYA